MPQSHQSGFLRGGFTIIEVAVTLGLLAALGGIATLNLSSIQNKTQLTTTVQTVISDLRLQQNRAMIGDTQGRANHDTYGIYFASDRYILFHGSSYVPSDTSNAPVMISQQAVQISSTFPNNQIVFSGLSGEVEGFSEGSNTITLSNTNTGEMLTLTMNRYGVIESML